MSNKVVINVCRGGFGLSAVAAWMLRNLGYEGDPDDIDRHDSRLICVVEALGTARASDKYARVLVVTLRTPQYVIYEYDGYERVVEQDDIDWVRTD